MAASSPRVRGDISYLPWCRCDGEALWVPPPGLRGSLPPSVGRRQEGQQTRKAQSGLLTLEARQPSPPPKGVHPFSHPKIAVARNGHHVVTTSFGLTPLHPARPLACNERLRRDERDGVGWRASASRYESEGRVSESPWAHLKFRVVSTRLRGGRGNRPSKRTRISGRHFPACSPERTKH